jgi:hypothetical protein
MAYMVTFHGVTQQIFDSLKGRIEGLGFSPPTGTEGIVSSADTEVGFRYSAGSGTLDVSIRRRPVLISHGQLYGMIADAIIGMGAGFTDALALSPSASKSS